MYVAKARNDLIFPENIAYQTQIEFLLAQRTGKHAWLERGETVWCSI